MNAELIEKIKEYVAECSYDPSGQMIWTKERKHLCDIRGWGNLQNKFSTEDEAATFQDGIGLFIQQAINERAALRVAEAKPQSISIEEFIEEWNVGYEDFEQKAEFANLMRSQIQAMIAEANKWVSVKDRLPQENKLVQCSSVRIHMGGETRQETCMGRLINANHPRFSCDVDWVKTTHWKELDEFVLPTPPTE